MTTHRVNVLIAFICLAMTGLVLMADVLSKMITYRLTSAGRDALLAMPADIESPILSPETIAKAKENLKGYPHE